MTLSVVDADPRAPVVTTSDITGSAGQVLSASSLFSVTDLDGTQPTAFQFWDNTASASSGSFTLNGVKQGEGRPIEVSASKLNDIQFHAGSVSDYLAVRAFDGQHWTDWTTWHVNPAAVPVDTTPPVVTKPSPVTTLPPVVTPPAVPSNNHVPVVTTSDVTAKAGQVLSASSLFSVTDLDGTQPTAFQFWDNTASASSGSFTLNGVKQGEGRPIEVSASKLNDIQFHAGSVSDYLAVRAFDGQHWTDWTTWHVNPAAVPVDTTPPVVTKPSPVTTLPPVVTPPAVPSNNHVPVVTTSDVTAKAGQVLSASSLFSVTDLDGTQPTAFQFWDNTASASSGSFTLNGVKQGEGRPIEVSASKLNDIQFHAGSVSDYLAVRAFDGQHWTDWTTWHVNPDPGSVVTPPPVIVTPPVVTPPPVVTAPPPVMTTPPPVVTPPATEPSDKGVTFESNQYVTIGTKLNYERDQSWSAIADVTIDRAPPSGGASLVFGNTNGAPFAGYELFIDEIGHLRVRIIDNYWGSNFLDVGGTTIVTDGQQHTIGASYNGSSRGSGVSLYVDGHLETTHVFKDQLTQSSVSTGPMVIGNQLNGWENQFQLRGFMDDFALSNVERPMTYFDPKSANFAVLDQHTAAAYNFNEGAGTTARDISGHGNTAALSSNAMWDVM